MDTMTIVDPGAIVCVDLCDAHTPDRDLLQTEMVKTKTLSTKSGEDQWRQMGLGCPVLVAAW